MSVLDLTEFFTTKEQSKDFSARLASLASSLYELDKDLGKSLQEQLGYQKKEKFLNLLRDNNIPLDSNQKITKFLERITKEISSMPEITITIAIEPNEEILKTIADWFLLNLEKQVLINISYNPKLIAGAEIDFLGTHVEFTVEKVLNSLNRIENSKPNQEERFSQEENIKQQKQSEGTQNNSQSEN